MNSAGKNKKQESSSELLQIVGIGASAGGLKALKEFFDYVPENSGLAYVVVVHLSTEHKSILAELLRSHVKMPVTQVNKTLKIEPNNVYVIPPNSNLNTIDTHLRLSKLEKKRSERAPIDHFLSTLSKTHKIDAIGIVLTGTGSDGTLGIKEIKERGGLTIVQDPNEAEYDGMPQSAISTGLVDIVLPVSQIPGYLVKFINTKPRLNILEEGKEPGKEEADLIQKIFALIKTYTSRNFSHYKMSTLMRRLQRRMQIYQVEQLEKYLEILRKNPEEVRQLSDDFLINVTSFFRDSEVFNFLKKNILPKIIAKKKTDEPLRIWSVGCASGEEAYSLAILLNEEIAEQEIAPEIKIFASDLHLNSLKKAREGFYPGDIKKDIGDERLKRFFIKNNGGYRIRKELREQVIFTPHNMLGDPPFTRLDIIVCRNLLIYLKREIQRDVFELFHYSLLANGYLVLGISESLEGADLFVPENKDYSVYRKKNVAGPEPRLPVFPKLQQHYQHHLKQEKTDVTVSLTTLHHKLLERYGPPSILLSPDYQVLHVSETAGKYLHIQRGEPSRDIFRLIRKELSVELRSSINAAMQKNKPAPSKPVGISIDGVEKQVIVSGHFVDEAGHDSAILVMFEETTKPVRTGFEDKKDEMADSQKGIRITQLEEELQENRQKFQAVIEEYETSREEMRASNEELQSANEELHSTLEELETSKEELQSVNEELTTVNQENQNKVEELSQLSDDLTNLLATTNVATLFLNRDLRIMRYTPQLGELFNIRMTDRGRPISDITSKLGYKELTGDAKEVLEKLQPIEKEILDSSGNTYLTRLVPYRSFNDKIEGVVITFLDISQRIQAEIMIKEREQLYRTLFKNTDDGFMLIKPVIGNNGKSSGEFIVTDVNKVWERQTSLETNDAIGKKLKEVFPETEDFLSTNFEKVIKTKKSLRFESYDKKGEKWFDLFAFNYKKGHVGVLYRDITKRKKAEIKLQENEMLYRTLFENSDDGFILHEPVFDENMICTDLLTLKVNKAWEQQTGMKISDGIMEKPISKLFPDLEKKWLEKCGTVVKNGITLDFEDYNTPAKKWFQTHMFPYKSGQVGILLKDITQRKEAEQQLNELNQSLEKQVLERTTQLKENKDLLKSVADAQTISLAALKAIRNNSGVIVDFEVMFANKMTEMIVGVKKNRDQLISQIIPEILKTEVFTNCCQVIETGINREDEYYFERDGLNIWIRIIAVKMGDGLVINAEDITSRKQTEKEILKMRDELARLATDRYKLLFDSISEGFCILKVLFNKKDEPVDYYLVEANPAFEKLTGFTGAVGKRIREIVPDIDQSWFDILGKTIKKGKSEHSEKQIEFLGNRWFDVFTIPIGNQPNQQLAVLFTDITKRKGMEQKISKLEKI